MNVNGKAYRSIWLASDGWSVEVIDQTRLPHEFVAARLTSLEEAAEAIRTMVVRGAPLIGATAAYGLCLALREDPSDDSLRAAAGRLIDTRPTAVNLTWAVRRVQDAVMPLPEGQRIEAAYECAAEICDEDVRTNQAIGRHGLTLLRDHWEHRRQHDRLNILTHCNAGWLATVDWGTALAPVYLAHDHGMPVHVWVDETRPRNQGASLTAWELLQHGISHTVIVDNAGGHLMQRNLVDCCLVGTDRTTAAGDVCNKIGTYLKALAARDNNVPFYVALPGSTIDWSIGKGTAGIEIEQRDVAEVTGIAGLTARGEVERIQLGPAASPAANYAFDITPAHLVTSFITERGICPAGREGLASLYPEHAGVDVGEAR
ncbi:MAG: S-methyl-5-thioribose-1-phosphate isomerase [Phycisphaerales bacterium]|nr:MAG: S-methyl-5-thioribose-1-phosphate isomerase [Phycisphaerales bacterium]